MRLRLILSFLLIVVVSIGSVVWIARQGTVREVRSFMSRGNMVYVDDIVSSLQDYYRLHSSWTGVESILQITAGMHGKGMGNPHGMMNQRLRLANPSGEVVFDSANETPVTSLSKEQLELAFPIDLEGRTVGFLYVEGGMSFNQSDESLLVNRLNQAALKAGLIAFASSLMIAVFLTYQLLRPVRALTQAAQRLGEGDFTQRVKVRGKDELAVLGKSFNRMADSLQQAQEVRRAMTADIAHELRNPLAVQRATLEALQDGVYPLAPENLQPALEQNELLARLVEDLRTLALADAGQLELIRAPTDISALLSRLIETYKIQTGERGIQIDYRCIPEDCKIPPLNIDALRVEQILNNLFSNALRYTPVGGLIEVNLQIVGKNVQILVHDNGPGIPEQALPYIFDRFYRVDRARSRSDGGSGLGLAIARQLAEAQGGGLSASNHPQGGAVFTLSLPMD